MAKTKNCIGVDIGTHSVRLAEVSVSSGRIHVRSLIEQPINLEAGADEEARQAAIASQIQAIVKSSKLKSKLAVFCMPGQSVFIRQLKVPATTPDRLNRIIQFEAREQIPFPLEKTSLEYQIFPTDDPSELEVLLVAIRRDHIESFMKMVRKTGLKLLSISVSSLALHNFHEVSAGPPDLAARISGDASAAARKPKKARKKKKGEEAGDEASEAESAGDEGFDSDEVLAEVNLGGTIMDLAIPKGGRGKHIGFTRSVPAAGIQMDRAIQRKLGLGSLAEARELKEREAAVLSSEFELDGDPTKVNMAASEVATAVADSLIVEIRRSLEYFLSQPEGVAADGIVLSGGLSELAYFDSYIEEKMGVPVERASLKSPLIEVPEEEKPKIARFVIPVGLAFQGLGVSQISVDFVPEEIKNVRALVANKKQLSAAAIALLLTMVLGIQAGGKYTDIYQTRAAEVQEMVNQYRDLDIKMKAELEKNAALAGKFRAVTEPFPAAEQTAVLDFMQQFNRLRPEELLITSMSIRRTGMVRIQGVTPRRSSVNRFIATLKENQSFVLDANLDKIEGPYQHPAFVGTEVYQFSISLAALSRTHRYVSARNAEVTGP